MVKSMGKLCELYVCAGEFRNDFVLQSGEEILEMAKTCERCRDAREFKNTC
jgi:hypothetical protein